MLTELVDPAGGRIEIRNITLGDKTMSVLEIWGAEYQERTALLLDPDRLDEFRSICAREKVTCEVLGEVPVTGGSSCMTRRTTPRRSTWNSPRS